METDTKFLLRQCKHSQAMYTELQITWHVISCFPNLNNPKFYKICLLYYKLPSSFFLYESYSYRANDLWMLNCHCKYMSRCLPGERGRPSCHSLKWAHCKAHCCPAAKCKHWKPHLLGHSACSLPQIPGLSQDNPSAWTQSLHSSLSPQKEGYCG